MPNLRETMIDRVSSLAPFAGNQSRGEVTTHRDHDSMRVDHLASVPRTADKTSEALADPH